MNSSRYLPFIYGLSLWVCLCACRNEPAKVKQAEVPVPSYASTKHLTEVDQLKAEMAADPTLVLIDVRKPELYDQGHIPGALNIWRPEIESTAYEYKGMRASYDQVEELLGNLGCERTSRIIIYDDQGNVDAARLWWILMYYGHGQTALLNGGLRAWKAAGYTLSQDTKTLEKADYRFTSDHQSDWLASTEDVTLALNQPNTILIDTRTWDEYTGKHQKKNAFKGGRIPGSIWIDWANTVNYDGDHKFKSYQSLLELYTAHGVNADQHIIAYCHSGVRSAHTTFVLTQLLGFEKVKNYDGSWTEWSYHPDLPIEKDSVTAVVM